MQITNGLLSDCHFVVVVVVAVAVHATVTTVATVVAVVIVVVVVVYVTGLASPAADTSATPAADKRLSGLLLCRCCVCVIRMRACFCELYFIFIFARTHTNTQLCSRIAAVYKYVMPFDIKHYSSARRHNERTKFRVLLNYGKYRRRLFAVPVSGLCHPPKHCGSERK